MAVMVARKWRGCLMWLLLLAASGPAFAQQAEFPFDSEMFLDARPMPGSRRIPNVEIGGNGAIVFELWCNRVDGQLVVAGNTLTVMLNPPGDDRSCSPEQAQRDVDLMAALNAVTNWRREGDDLVLVGPTTLRFKAATH